MSILILDRLPSRLPGLLEWGLLALLALQAARLLWLALTPIGPVGAPGQPRTDTAPAPAPAAFADVFFRNMTVSGADVDPSGLRLLGVRVATDGAGSAILAADGRQRAWRVGDEVAPGAVLEAVAADHVLLRTGAGLRRLELPASASSIPAQGGGPVAALPTGAPPRPAATATAQADPARLLSEAGLRARTGDDGRVSGYVLMPRGDGAVLRQAGLQPGDVLLSVNGRALDPERLEELAGELRENPRATITYQRGTETRTLTLQGERP